MRYSLANVAILASSLLVKDVFAAPFQKRDLYLVEENIVVTEEVAITQLSDGSMKTGAPHAVGTATSLGQPVLVSSSTSAPPPPPPTTTAAPVAATFKEEPKPTTTAAPVKVAETTAAPPPPAPTTSAAPAPAAPISTGGNKRGLAYNDPSLLAGFVSGSNKVSWTYNWGSSSGSIPSGLEYIPMLWGLSGDHTGNWNDAANKAIAAGSKHLLAMNEPDLGAQSNLSPGAAAAGYKTFMQPFAGKAALGSPAVTNGGSPMGVAWLTSFLQACQGCTVDFVALHWYNGGDAQAFKTYMTNAHQATGKPLWITEFEAPGNDAQKAAFLAEVLPWLDSQDFIQRYAYFGVFQGNLVSGSSPNALGKQFAGLA